MKVCQILDWRAVSGTLFAERPQYPEIKKKGLQAP